MLRVNEDNLEVLVRRVLIDPVRVKDTQVGATTANTLLSGGAERALVLELVNSHVGGLTYSKEKKMSASMFFSFFHIF